MKREIIKTRPLLMSGPLVRATLDGLKTQTRRPIKRQPPEWSRLCQPEWYEPAVEDRWGDLVPGKPIFGTYDDDEYGVRCPYGAPGDRLWVRETWAGDDLCGVVYRADHPNADLKRGDLDDGDQSIRRWRPSIYMPRWASRLTLEVTDVRVERVQDIMPEDAIAEGVPELFCDAYPHSGLYPWDCPDCKSAPEQFAAVWDSIYKPPFRWESNPWVWVVSYKVVTQERSNP